MAPGWPFFAMGSPASKNMRKAFVLIEDEGSNLRGATSLGAGSSHGSTQPPARPCGAHTKARVAGFPVTGERRRTHRSQLQGGVPSSTCDRSHSPGPALLTPCARGGPFIADLGRSWAEFGCHHYSISLAQRQHAPHTPRTSRALRLAGGGFPTKAPAASR